jgi:hypothetical protein
MSMLAIFFALVKAYTSAVRDSYSSRTCNYKAAIHGVAHEDHGPPPQQAIVAPSNRSAIRKKQPTHDCQNHLFQK